MDWIALHQPSVSLHDGPSSRNGLRVGFSSFGGFGQQPPHLHSAANSPLYDAAVSQHLGRLEHRPHFVWETQLAIDRELFG
ncbi:hypothetical protein HDV63DRAFT_92804 [Trichoderma sp. SZMC 28014]